MATKDKDSVSEKKNDVREERAAGAAQGDGRAAGTPPGRGWREESRGGPGAVRPARRRLCL